MSVDSTGKVGSKDIRTETEATKLLRAKLEQSTEAVDKKGAQSAAGALVDKVNVDIARAINQQINPAVILSGRADKVAKLKELIAKGEYNPSSELVARAVGDEIVQEILFAGDSKSILGEDEK